MNLQEYISFLRTNKNVSINDVYEYAFFEERNFEKQAEETGYTRKTTFYSDLSIAEWYGKDTIIDTFNNVCKEWKKDIVFFTEFVLSLNWKCWEWANRENTEWSELYRHLYEKADAMVFKNFKDDDVQYYLRTTD